MTREGPGWHRSREALHGMIPLLLLCGAVGLLTGLVGGGFRLVVDRAGAAVAGLSAASDLGPLSWLVPVLLCAGAVALSVWGVRRFAPEAAGSGVQEIEGALDGSRTLRWRRVLPVKFVGGTLSLSTGLALGREGPTIQMGGALGQMVAEGFRLPAERVHTLVAAGAGAGLAAAFNAPFAGILFVIEEMRPQFHYHVASVQGVFLACAASDAVVRWMLGPEATISMPVYPTPEVASLGLFLVFGGVVGLVGLAFNALLVRTLDGMDAVPPRLRLAAAAAVGAIVGGVLWIDADGAGGGYRAIEHALAGAIPLTAMLPLFLVRLATSVLSYGSGAPGGIFAPMLALGTLLGLAFGGVCTSALPGLAPHPGLFAVVGMGALFAATVRAPLTAIALATELTGNFGQILPLTVACVTATTVTHGLGGRPIYSVLLERTLARSQTE